MNSGIDYFDSLPKMACGLGRLVMGHAFDQPVNERPTLLLVHGAFHGAWCYGLWLQELDRLGWPAASLDVRGHGGLHQTGEFHRFGVYDMAEDIRAVQKLVNRPIVLCGHSLGALMVGVAAEAMTLAGLVLLAPSPPGQLSGAKSIPRVPEDKAIMPPSLTTAGEKFFPRLDMETIAILVSRLVPESPVLLNDRFTLRVPVDNEKINAPALCISSGLDDLELHPPGQDEAVATFYGGEYHHLPNASHCFMCDPDWGAGLEIILNWLGGVDS